jgi:hypothetical protein
MAKRAHGWDEYYKEQRQDPESGEERQGRRRDYRPFEEAREWVRRQNLRSAAAYRAWAQSGQRPADIPQHPEQLYRSTGWVGWADWLGGTVRRLSN